jgi:hypothetical protein
LELHLGRSWRDHDDTDVAVLRDDCPQLLRHLEAVTGWQAWLAAAGVLSRYGGQELSVDRHENNVWMKGDDGAWVLDLTVSHGTPDAWVYRRDERFALPWDRAVLQTAGAIPYLAPALQVLYKSARPRPKDDADAREVIPELAPREVALLRGRLPADHPWQQLVDRTDGGQPGA